MKLSEYLVNVGKPFAYYPTMALALGSVKASILLCALVWKDTDRTDGKIKKRLASISKETGLSDREMRTARRVLEEKHKIVKTECCGFERQMIFVVDFERLDALLGERLADAKTPNPDAETSECIMSKRQNDPGETSESIPSKGQDDLSFENKNKKKDENKQEPLPDWIPLEAWDGWVEMRKLKRVPLTPHIVSLAIKNLDDLRRAGNDPAAVLEQSTLRGWTGLFELRKAGNNGTRAEQRRQANREACRRADERAEARTVETSGRVS